MKKILFTILFLPYPLFALEPSQVEQFGTAAETVYNAYARALSYLPESWADNIQKKSGIWAHDPAGHSIYGVSNNEVGPDGTGAASSTFWTNSPYVIGGTTNGAWSAGTSYVDGMAGENVYESRNVWTRGYNVSFSGVSSCDDRQVYLFRGAPYKWHEDRVYTCPANMSELCITGGGGINFSTTYWDRNGGANFSHDNLTLYQVQDSNQSAYDRSLYYYPNCAPVILSDEFSHWQELPLDDQTLTDTGSMIAGMIQALANPSVWPSDVEQIQDGLNVLQNGVEVPNGVIPNVVSEVPSELWDFETGVIISSGGTSGGGTSIVNNITVVSSPTINVSVVSSPTVSLNISTDTGGYDSQFQNAIALEISSATGIFNHWGQSIKSAFVPVSSDTWDGCFDLTFTAPSMGTGETLLGRLVCVSDFGAQWVIDFIKALLYLTACVTAAYILIEVKI